MADTTIPLRPEKTTIAPGSYFPFRAYGDAVDSRISDANIYLEIAKNTKCAYARDFGAKFDGVELTDINCTNGNAIISSASYTFSAADQGKTFALFSEIKAATSTLSAVGTISGVSGNQATLSVAAGHTITNNSGIFRFASDDRSALQAAFDSVNPDDNGSTGTWTYKKKGVVMMPVGAAAITAPVEMRSCVSPIGQEKWATNIWWHSTQNMAQTGYFSAFNGIVANGSTRIYRHIYFKNFGIDMRAAKVPAGGYSYHSKCSEMVYTLYCGVINCAAYGSPGTSFGWDFNLGGLLATENHVFNPGRLWVTGGGGGSAFDFQTVANPDPNIVDTSLEASILARNVITNPKVSGIRNSSNQANPTAANNTRVLICENLVVTSLVQGKGIEDNAHTGSALLGNILICKVDQTSEGNLGAGGNGSGQEIWAGILLCGGWFGICSANTVIGYYDCIKLIRDGRGTSTLMPDDYTIDNNILKGAVRNGIRVEVNFGYILKRLRLTGNKVCFAGEAGIALTYVTGGSAGSIAFLELSGNHSHDNGRTTATDAQKSGVYINVPIDAARMCANMLFDSGAGTQKYGYTVDGVALTSTMMNDNHAEKNTTATGLNLINGGTVTGKIKDNLGIDDV